MFGKICSLNKWNLYDTYRAYSWERDIYFTLKVIVLIRNNSKIDDDDTNNDNNNKYLHLISLEAEILSQTVRLKHVNETCVYFEIKRKT